MAISIKTGAKAVAKYTGVLLDFLDNTNSKLRPLANIPLIGDTIGDVQDLISMLHAYYHGSYKKVPAVVMLGTAAIVAYLVSPLDIIPDNVPILGFIDDALSLIADKKVRDFFARFKYATFFAKINFHEKSRRARQKV